MDSVILNIVFLFGALQALLLIVGVNIRNPLNSPKKQTTTLLLFTIFIAMVYYVSIVSEWKILYNYFGIFGSTAWMAITPAYFLFVDSMTTDNFKFQNKHILYFSVPIIFLFDGIISTVQPEYGLFFWITSFETYLDIWMLTFFLSSSYFIISSYLILSKREGQVLTKSLSNFTKALIAVLATYALAYIIIRKNYHLLFEVSLICLFMVLIFAIVFRAFRLAPAHTFFGEPKYQNLKDNQETVFGDLNSTIKSAINQEKLYLDPKLNLSKLSEKTGISQNQLSQYFNIGLNSSFYKYINEIRLLHVEKLIHKGGYKDFTITGLAFESGFNSKTTFYKVFKEKHEITPSEYISRVANSVV